jgi:hypothetical protein
METHLFRRGGLASSEEAENESLTGGFLDR